MPAIIGGAGLSKRCWCGRRKTVKADACPVCLGLPPKRRLSGGLRGPFPHHLATDVEIEALYAGTPACAICGIREAECLRRLAVDHCHQTGKVRGLLCGKCNMGLGLLGDDVEQLHRAIRYLSGAAGKR